MQKGFPRQSLTHSNPSKNKLALPTDYDPGNRGCKILQVFLDRKTDMYFGTDIVFIR